MTTTGLAPARTATAASDTETAGTATSRLFDHNATTSNSTTSISTASNSAMADTVAAGVLPARQRSLGGETPRLLAAALDYIEDQRWEVALGTSVRRSPAGLSCSCDNPRCPVPGAHPAQFDWQKQISGQPGKAREWWTASPEASVLLPTGRSFDALEVPESAGCLGLARLERAGAAVGPVAATPDRRMYFLVLPDSRIKTIKLLTAFGWGGSALDLVCRSTGNYIVAPPSRMGALGRAQWVRPPSATHRSLPDAEEVLAPLAYACKLHC